METVLENFVLIDKYPIFKLFLQGEIVIVCHTEQEARNCIDWLAEHDITYVNGMNRETYYISGEDIYYVYNEEEHALKFSHPDIFTPRKGKNMEKVELSSFFAQLDILLPCPFCGSSHLEYSFRTDDNEFYSVMKCKDCQAIGPRYVVKDVAKIMKEENKKLFTISRDKRFKQKAMMLWNKRKVE